MSSFGSSEEPLHTSRLCSRASSRSATHPRGTAEDDVPLFLHCLLTRRTVLYCTVLFTTWLFVGLCCSICLVVPGCRRHRHPLYAYHQVVRRRGRRNGGALHRAMELALPGSHDHHDRQQHRHPGRYGAVESGTAELISAQDSTIMTVNSTAIMAGTVQ